MSNLVLPNLDWGLGLNLYASISIYFLWAYTKYILTIVVPKGVRVNGTSHLWIIEVYHYKVTYAEHR